MVLPSEKYNSQERIFFAIPSLGAPVVTELPGYTHYYTHVDCMRSLHTCDVVASDSEGANAFSSNTHSPFLPAVRLAPVNGLQRKQSRTIAI